MVENGVEVEVGCYLHVEVGVAVVSAVAAVIVALAVAAGSGGSSDVAVGHCMKTVAGGSHVVWRTRSSGFVVG